VTSRPVEEARAIELAGITTVVDCGTVVVVVAAGAAITTDAMFHVVNDEEVSVTR
jgi:hypothetical protein